eukprot:CAMPEP_0178956688 /NCGR_PEP_ID=MMETSP0789-20121207/10432_1 /TAXON_ID=3005 /ORGANISM="Rhizosolenia setigera, Strain CCMP 1694" /LENGTH=368 /DNA_ID=CAMNT_0020638723 /DNA_START=8 /DNA_END=1114 /DNA_ORIENTATION=+
MYHFDRRSVHINSKETRQSAVSPESSSSPSAAIEKFSTGSSIWSNQSTTPRSIAMWSKKIMLCQSSNGRGIQPTDTFDCSTPPSSIEAEEAARRNIIVDEDSTSESEGSNISCDDHLLRRMASMYSIASFDMHQIQIIPEEVPSEDSSLKSHSSPPYILNKAQMKKIAYKALPDPIKYANWKCLYSLSRDGDVFETMLRNCSANKRTLLVIKTTLGEILGGFVDQTWKVQKPDFHIHGGANSEFFGSGQAVLFSITRTSSEEEDDKTVGDGQLQVYKWSGANRYIQLCDSEKQMIAMGGGGKTGNFGLCVLDNFRYGSTGRCETFQNEPLIEERKGSNSHEDENNENDDQTFFDVLDMEVWGFVNVMF